MDIFHDNFEFAVLCNIIWLIKKLVDGLRSFLGVGTAEVLTKDFQLCCNELQLGTIPPTKMHFPLVSSQLHN